MTMMKKMKVLVMMSFIALTKMLARNIMVFPRMKLKRRVKDGGNYLNSRKIIDLVFDRVRTDVFMLRCLNSRYKTRSKKDSILVKPKRMKDVYLLAGHGI